MMKCWTSLSRGCGGLMALLLTIPAHAVDSYRFLHVTIETPWMIFMFLLVIVLFPFILSAILHWHFANKKSPQNDDPPKS